MRDTALMTAQEAKKRTPSSSGKRKRSSASSNQAENEDDADTGSERSISGESNMEASLMRMIDGLGDDDAVEHKREIENKKAAADSKRADADGEPSVRASRCGWLSVDRRLTKPGTWRRCRIARLTELSVKRSGRTEW